MSLIVDIVDHIVVSVILYMILKVNNSPNESWNINKFLHIFSGKNVTLNYSQIKH